MLNKTSENVCISGTNFNSVDYNLLSEVNRVDTFDSANYLTLHNCAYRSRNSFLEIEFRFAPSLRPTRFASGLCPENSLICRDCCALIC